MRKRNFNHGWVFHEGGGSSLAALMGEEALTKNVILPHDASIEKVRDPEALDGNGNGFFQEKTVHYTKEFMLDEEDKGKNIWLEFEGVYQNAYVYINNSYAGKCPYGYSNFYIDATKYIQFDKKNQIKVLVKNGVPSGRWYTGCGIYRNVNLMTADRMHLVPDGVHLKAIDVEAEQAVIKTESVIEYTGTGVKNITLNIQLSDAEGMVVAEDQMTITVEEHTKQSYIQKIYVDSPKLWDLDLPYLYTYRAILKEKDVVLDEEEGTFGIRKLQLDTKHGLRINGKTVKLRGGCIHHDNGVIGAAEFAHAAEFRVRRMKEVGYNAIRSAHYPMSRKLLDACDKIGMLVMDEFSDVWTSTKIDYDYGIHMAEWWEHDVTNMVKKDYNHPCVIMYSIGNEIIETGNPFDVQWGKKIADRIRSLDDSRYVTNSVNLMLSIMDQMGEIIPDIDMGNDTVQADAKEIGKNTEINSTMSNLNDMYQAVTASDIAGRATEEAFAQVDIAGYNYASFRYGQDAALYPNRVIVGSETYPKDLDVNWELVEKYSHVIGDFSWTAWDYLGEAGIGKITYAEKQEMNFYASYPYKAAYCGDMNLIGDRRPVSFWREMIWGLRKAPYISVQPPQYHDVKHNMTQWSMTDAVRSWNWDGFEEKPVTVEVYADADEAALFVNGKLIEKKIVGEDKKFITLFETVYVPGILETVIYKNGEEIGRDILVTAGDSVQIAASSDTSKIPADASDIGYVEISFIDKEGNLNPNINKEVTVFVEGPGVILGYGSADPASEENYFDTTVKAYEGRLRAAVRGIGKTGTITVTFKAEGCKDVTVRMEAI